MTFQRDLKELKICARQCHAELNGAVNGSWRSKSHAIGLIYKQFPFALFFSASHFLGLFSPSSSKQPMVNVHKPASFRMLA